MATQSSILARRIPWTEEPGGLQSMGSKRVGRDWVTNTFRDRKGCAEAPWMCFPNLPLEVSPLSHFWVPRMELSSRSTFLYPCWKTLNLQAPFSGWGLDRMAYLLHPDSPSEQEEPSSSKVWPRVQQGPFLEERVLSRSPGAQRLQVWVLRWFQKEPYVRPGSGTGPVALVARTQAFRPGGRWW